jgi:DNA-binding IclR family transcriptional regulator
MDDWWKDFEEDILRCLAGRDAVSPTDVARKLGIPEAAATSLLAIMAREGKVRIRTVEAA